MALGWALASAFALACGQALAEEAKDNVAGPYVPTPWEIVDEMLKLAEVSAKDTLYDLGSGDGRLVITAAKRYGARGAGIELQPQLVELAREQAAKEGVAGQVQFLAADLFESDVSHASVVTLYLLPRFVTRLVPKLRAELAPGSRIVAHDYPLSPWPPDKTLSFDVPEKERISGSTRTTLYYYVVPARVSGTWVATLPRALSPMPIALRIKQEPDSIEGTAEIAGDAVALRDIYLKADALRFSLFHRGRFMHFSGTAKDDAIAGEVRSGKINEPWSAKRAIR